MRLRPLQAFTTRQMRTEKALQAYLDLEPSKKYVNGVLFYNAKSVSGQFAGMFQMGAAAWADAMRITPSLPSYQVGKFDARANVLAGASFAKANIAAAKSMGYNGPIDGNVLYAMHNQGASGFVNAWRTGRTGPHFANQSSAARSVITAALQGNSTA